MPAGAPTKYSEKRRQAAAILSPLGLTDYQMALCMGISEATFNNWKSQHPEFLESLKGGKADADSQVEASLYQQALRGDVKACVYWLNNRQPEKWRNRTEVALTAVDDRLRELAEKRIAKD